MSQPLHDQGEEGNNLKTPDARWRQVLRLGEELLSLGEQLGVEGRAWDDAHQARRTILEQSELIIATAEILLGSQVVLWLPRWLGLETGAITRKGQTFDEVSHLFTQRPPTVLMRRALEERRLCTAQEIDNTQIKQSNDIGALAGNSQAASAVSLAIPLLAMGQVLGQVLGVLEIDRLSGQSFGSQDIELFEALAIQASIALQANRQAAIERWRIAQLSLVRQVSQQLVQMHDLDDLARQVTNLILETFDYYYVAIFTLEPGEERLCFQASAGPGNGGILRRLDLESENDEAELATISDQDFSPILRIRLGEGMVGSAAQNGQEILANDVNKEKCYRRVDALPETLSEFVLPLKIEDRVLGVLDVQSAQVDDFHQIDVLVLRALAGNIALAVEGARLYSALRRRADQLAAVSEVSSAITSILDQEELLQRVTALIYERFGFPFVHLFSVHPGRRKIIYEEGSGLRSKALCEQDFTYELDDPHGMIPWVARHGQTLLANDVQLEPLFRPSPLPPTETRAELTVPLKFAGQVLGVLDIQSDQINAFAEDDRFLFEALADNIAIAMRNASLYRSEHWRRQVAESLQQVAGLLSAEVELSHVLQAVLAELERNLPCDLAAVWLLDRNRADARREEENLSLRLAAVYGVDAAWLEPQVGLNLDEIIGQNDNAGKALLGSSQSLWLLEALSSEKPVIREADSSTDVLGVALEYPHDYSAIAAPLRAGDQRLGVLTLVHHTIGRYGSEARAMTAAFASYAAVAIENTRLFEEAHEQVWVSTVLLQVAEATQSASELNELLETIVNITPMLVGVKTCAVYTLNEDGLFLPEAAGGLSIGKQSVFGSWSFAPGDVPALDRLMSEKLPSVLQRQGEDARLASIFSGEEGEVLEFLILVPLLARSELLGVMLVGYHNDPYKGMLQDLEAFFDERLPIIQGIAHQTAMAMENVHLERAQREEAYVSVALLQVAQAVVSSNDLDEARAAIVRITPILTGMKRSAIYLWDEPSAYFHLAQSYGLPREAMMYQYSLDEFPLLEAAYNQNRLLTYPVQRSVRDWDDVPDVWTYLPAVGVEEIEEYFQSEAQLLLAFPLSVKGSVLGVLLVEEPDPVPAQGMDGGNANRRMRTKRLEITTGISQQIALAIQNEHLQRDLVVRERLEREMQLAREIQRTFLPSELPEMPGWEMNVWWRTAREMSGDFYDFFELPGGRLGLVIADVADKGMAAALFMTLIRTLLRAEARDSDSPAEVLAGVNDLLVPDSQKGMFVTLVYGVLDPKSGTLTYANAGHNPPLWVKMREVNIETLDKSGMALGVYEGSPIEERSIQLQRGDTLVLYTDGVTEAFSPEWMIYGAERLWNTVWEAAFGSGVVTAGEKKHKKEPRVKRGKKDRSMEASARSGQISGYTLTAQRMLEAIDASVKQFVGDAAPSDDSTVVVLMRQAG